MANSDCLLIKSYFYRLHHLIYFYTFLKKRLHCLPTSHCPYLSEAVLIFISYMSLPPVFSGRGSNDYWSVTCNPIRCRQLIAHYPSPRVAVTAFCNCEPRGCYKYSDWRFSLPLSINDNTRASLFHWTPGTWNQQYGHCTVHKISRSRGL